MSLPTTALALVALFAQIGSPVAQDGPLGRDAWVDEPVWESDAAAPEADEVEWPDASSWAGDVGGEAAGDPAFASAVALRDRLGPEDWLWIERMAASLTLEEKVGQLVVSYIEGGRPEPGGARWKRAVRLVELEKVGGLIVGVGSGHETAAWLNELQERSSLPLLVTADLEWGPGTRLRGATVLPINMAVAAAGSADLAFEAGRITALEARAAGVHMAFAPVADVNVNPENPVINTRSYGSDPGGVSERVVAFIEGARSAGLMTVVKHFPGHGDTETDSHLELPVLDVDRFRLDDVELRPFRAAIAGGVEGVMTGHLALPLLDPTPRPRPATLSPPILTDLLRQEMGFEGLIVTDALHMDGVKDSGRTGVVAVAAILARADILLIPPDEAEAIAAVVEAVRRGELSEARIDRSVRRVLMAKAAAGLSRERRTNLGVILAQVGRSDHGEWARRVAERSITVPRAEPRSLPLNLPGRAVLVVIYDDARSHSAGRVLERALADRGARVQTIRLSRGSGEVAIERVRRAAAEAEVAVFASFSRAVPWKGALGLPDAVVALATELALNGAPVISFGDPYLIRQLPAAATYMLAWDRAEVSQEAAVRALAGEIPIAGRLPIDLPGGFGVGEGVVVPTLPGITRLPLRWSRGSACSRAAARRGCRCPRPRSPQDREP